MLLSCFKTLYSVWTLKRRTKIYISLLGACLWQFPYKLKLIPSAITESRFFFENRSLSKHVFLPYLSGALSGLLRMMAVKKTPFSFLSLKYVTHPLSHIPQWLNLAQLILPKEDSKSYESRDTPLEFRCRQYFFFGNQQFLLYRKIQIKLAFSYIIFLSFDFFESEKLVLINMIVILMMLAKLTTLALVKEYWASLLTSLFLGYLELKVMTSPIKFYHITLSFIWEKLS